jgi:hypothetical protein
MVSRGLGFSEPGDSTSSRRDLQMEALCCGETESGICLIPEEDRKSLYSGVFRNRSWFPFKKGI